MKFLNILSSFSDSELLSSDVSSLMDWCAEWSLNLNVSKCVHITFSLLQSSAGSSYSIDGSELDRVEKHCDLCVIVTSNLSWSCHYQKVCSQAYQAIYMVHRNIPSTASCYLRRELYLTLMRSQICYCSQLWSPMYLNDISTLELVQHRATKFILPGSTLSYKERLIELKLLSLMHWYDFQDILFILKCILHPPDNFNIFKVLSAEFYFHKTITVHLELYLFYCFIHFLLYIGQY